MRIHSSPFEQTTALTDLLLGLLAAYAALRLAAFSGFKPQLWAWTFGLLAVASALGAIAHGFEMKKSTNDLIWKPLNLSLGWALGLFVVGATLDFWGEDAARKTLPFMLTLGVFFWGATFIFPSSFLTFIIYESVAMIFALGAYAYLYYANALLGAGWMTLGVFVTILAAVAQAIGKAGKPMLWRFDNNGVFHLIQMPGIILLLTGIMKSL